MPPLMRRGRSSPPLRGIYTRKGADEKELSLQTDAVGEAQIVQTQGKEYERPLLPTQARSRW